MALESPFFLVNFKTVAETVGADGLAFARTIERVGADTGCRFAVAPHAPDIRLVADRTDLPIVAQSATRREDATPGSATLEAVAAAGADAVFLNHPENEDAFADVSRKIDRCAELGLDSICGVDSLEQGRAALTFDPDWLLFERPDDIASEEGLIRTHPERIAAFVEMVEREPPSGDETSAANETSAAGGTSAANAATRTRVFVGGGIRTADDVERAFAHGVDAAGAATAALEADDLEAWLRSVASAVPRSSE